MMNDGIVSTNSNESNSDDGKNRLISTDSMFPDNAKEQMIAKQLYTTKISSIRKLIFNEKDVIRPNKTINRINSNDFEHNDNDTVLFRPSVTHTNQSYRQSKDSQYHEDERLTSINNDIYFNEDLRLEKTGWLNVKHWLTIPYHENIQLTSQHQWKRFWMWLKDSHLHLYNDYSDINPDFTINTIDCLCYPLPEYRHRQHVFSLTTNTGDVYYLQSSNQSEVDHWIYCIHSNCLLNRNLRQLENEIIDENQMIKLKQEERNLEIFYINLFRKKCYLSALNKNENLPNSIDLLSQISLTTKMLLCNLDVFTPCGLYAYVISRRTLDTPKSKLKEQIAFSNSISSIEIEQTVLFDFNPQKKMMIAINKMTTVNELLKRVTEKLNLSIDDYFLYCYSTSSDGFIPNRNDILDTLMYSSIEIHQKMTYEIILNNQLNLSGIDLNQQYPLTVFVSNVKERSEGERLGIIKGDEIIMINNSLVKDLDSTRFNRYLNQIPTALTFRSSRLNRSMNTSQRICSRKLITSTVQDIQENNQLSSIMINTNNEQQSCVTPQSNIQHIQKVIRELIETETSYVQDLQCLINQYIKPLCNHSTVLPSDTIESLYKHVKSIHQLQTIFLDNLQSNVLTDNILTSISETFIKTSKDFKLYSTYCVIHLRLNRLLNQYQNNEYLKEFLLTCNPYNQHSLSFESYLIKPVQRILKYPLFLQQIFDYCHTDKNHQILSKLKKAIKIMNKITQYINSMQQLYEDFGQSFEYFIKNSKEQHNQMFELNLPDLCAYGEINWLNIYRFISKKNCQCLKIFCFIFRNGCFILVREQLNKKNQDLLLNSQSNKSMSDSFLRFLPIQELQAEMLNNNNKSDHYTWQLIQTDAKTQVKTYFHFANKDAQMFVKTINDCISKVKCQHAEYMSISEQSNSLEISSNQQQRLLSSRSCHDFLLKSSLSNQNLESNRFRTNRQSPSPIWKRRTISSRK